MNFNGEVITYTEANAAQMDKKLPNLNALSISGVVSTNGIKGLDGIDVALVHGKRNTLVHLDDWLETEGNKKDFTHKDCNIVCQGTTNEQIDQDYTRQVGQDTWKTNKGETIEHFVGQLTNIHKEDKHIDEPFTLYEVQHAAFGVGVIRADIWVVFYSILATYSTSFFKYNGDFRLIDSCFKYAVSEHIATHFCEKDASAEGKTAEGKVTGGSGHIKPAALEAGAAEAHEVGVTQNLATVGPNSNI